MFLLPKSRNDWRQKKRQPTIGCLFQGMLGKGIIEKILFLKVNREKTHVVRGSVHSWKSPTNGSEVASMLRIAVCTVA